MPESHKGFTTGEAAEQLGVPSATLKVWLDRLPIPTTLDRRGFRRLDEKAMALLEVVKADRARGLGYDTLRRKLAPEASEPTTGNTEGQAVAEPAAQVDTLHLAQVIREVMNQEGGLAHQLAAYAHKAGELTAENRNLLVDKDRLGQQLAAQAAEIERATKEAEEQRAEAERLRIEVERLRAEKEAQPKPRDKGPWWRFGRP